MKTLILFTFLASVSFAQTTPKAKKIRGEPQEPKAQRQATRGQIYSLEAPQGGDFQTRISLGLQSGTLKFATENETQRIEGLDTNFSAAFGMTDVLSFGARGYFADSTSGGTVASTSRASGSKTGLGDAEVFLTTRIVPGAVQMYLNMIGGIKTGDFEFDAQRGRSTNSSGGYYIEPQFAGSISMGSFLLGGSASYRYHFNRQVVFTGTSGTETLRLDPGNRIRATVNSEVQIAYPFGIELEYILQDRYEAFSVLSPGGQRVTFGNTSIFGGSFYMRFPTHMGFGNLEIVPWVNYQTNIGKKRGVGSVDDDQLFSFMLKMSLTM